MFPRNVTECQVSSAVGRVLILIATFMFSLSGLGQAVDYFALGGQAAAKGDYASAAREFAEAREENPARPGIEKRLGLAAFQAKEFKEAIVPLERARAINPNDMQVLLALGGCY